MIQFKYTQQEGIDNKSLLHLALLLILVLSLFALVSLYVGRSIRAPHPAGTLTEQSVNPFDTFSLEAKSAIVVDLQKNKILFEKDADVARPIASITKVMTAVTALDLVTESSVVTIDRTFLDEEGDSGLYPGERWQLRELLDLSLVGSSNDAAAAIAAVVGVSQIPESDLSMGRTEFIAKMNKKAQLLGMTSAVFRNETGLDIPSENTTGGEASARDLVTLMQYAITNHRDIFDGTRQESVSLQSLNNISHTTRNTNTVVYEIPNVIVSKTGYTDLAGGNLAVVFDAGINKPIAVIVLGSTREGRFIDVKNLSYAALEYISEGR